MTALVFRNLVLEEQFELVLPYLTETQSPLGGYLADALRVTMLGLDSLDEQDFGLLLIAPPPLALAERLTALIGISVMGPSSSVMLGLSFTYRHLVLPQNR